MITKRASIKRKDMIQSIKSIILRTSVQSSGPFAVPSSSVSLNVSLCPYEIQSSSPAWIQRKVLYVMRRLLRSLSQPTFWLRLEWLNMLPSPKTTLSRISSGEESWVCREFTLGSWLVVLMSHSSELWLVACMANYCDVLVNCDSLFRQPKSHHVMTWMRSHVLSVVKKLCMPDVFVILFWIKDDDRRNF